MARGNAVCSPSYELTCSSPVRAPRSTTSTAAFSPRACSGRWSCPATPSRSATTGGGPPWKPRMSACWTASSSAGRPPSRPRSASRSGGRPPAHGSVAAKAQRSHPPTRRHSWATSPPPGPPGRSPDPRSASASRAGATPPAAAMPSSAPSATASSSHGHAGRGTSVPRPPESSERSGPGAPSTSGASASPGCLSTLPLGARISSSRSAGERRRWASRARSSAPEAP